MSKTNVIKPKEVRARGAKPQDPVARRTRVKVAVRDLERIGAAFSVADIAERAGVSRATIYRSQDLRDLIGAKGDGPRVVDAVLHEKICARHDTQKAKVRDLRRHLSELEASWDEMRERAKAAEQKLAAAERRIELQSAQMRGGVGGALDAVASRLSSEERRRARRVLARALHPDLFAQDTAEYTLATELLKTLNALAE